MSEEEGEREREEEKVDESVQEWKKRRLESHDPIIYSVRLIRSASSVEVLALACLCIRRKSIDSLEREHSRTAARCHWWCFFYMTLTSLLHHAYFIRHRLANRSVQT